MIVQEARWRRREDVLWRRSLDAVVVLPAGTDEPVAIAGTGAAVWDLLEEPGTLDEIVEALLERYEADAAVVSHDVVELLERLAEMGAVSATVGTDDR